MAEMIDQSGSNDQLRVGVYVCRCGGNISDVVDVERVAKVVERLPNVALAKIHTFMCSDPAQLMIAEDIRKENLDRVVVASCSPFLHELTFRRAVSRGGLNPYLYEHVNIREQDSWSHKSDAHGATSKAIRLIAAAIGRVVRAQPLKKITLPNHRRALVIGGGVAGMKAAVDLAQMGIPVILVEQAPSLGGNLLSLGSVYGSERRASEIVDSLRREMDESSNVTVLTDAEIVSMSGFIGNYEIALDVTSDGARKRLTYTVGAVIVATGFEPYTPRQGEYGFGQFPEVVTMPDFIRLLNDNDGSSHLTFNGRPLRNVVFIHCVGSRQIEGVHEPGPDGTLNTYCSRTCCTTVLHQAVRLKSRYPDVNVFDIYQDIRTYGRGEEDYYIHASEAGVVFLRYHGDDPPVVQRADGDGRSGAPLRVVVNDWLTWGEEIHVPADLVVLAVGMQPRKIDKIIDLLKLPVGEDRFLQEVHPKLRPVETSVDGVLLAGTAQGPMNIVESMESASAAAAKASILLGTEAVEIDPFVAEVDGDLCNGCGLCLAECEYSGALTLAERQTDAGVTKVAVVNPGLCKGCGACVAVCPTRAINIMGWRLEQFDAMIDGIVAEVTEARSAAS